MSNKALERSKKASTSARAKTMLVVKMAMLLPCFGGFRCLETARESYGCPAHLASVPRVMRLRGSGVDEEEEAQIRKVKQLLEKAEAGFRQAGLSLHEDDPQLKGKPKPKARMDSINQIRAALENYERCVDKNEISKLEAVQNVLKAAGEDTGFPDSQGGLDSQSDLQVAKAELEAKRILKSMVEEGYRKKLSIWNDLPAFKKLQYSIAEDDHYPLWKAVIDKNTERLKFLLQTEPKYDVNHVFNTVWNSTLAHAAAEMGDVDLMAVLVYAGADVTRLNGFQQTPLHLAAYWGCNEIVEMLVDIGTPVEERSWDDSTALHISVFHGKDTTTKKLVQLGASLTSINKHKHNALDLAEYRRWPELANFLRTEMKLPPSETDWDDEEQKFREVKQQCIDRMATELERRMRSEMQLDEGHEGPANPPKLHPKAENEIRKIIEGHAHEEALTLMRKKK